MSLKKLTLTVDESVIEKAREYSARYNTSISRLVTQFLSKLPIEQKKFTPTVRRLIGILPRDVSVTDYYEHLEDKHGR